MMKITKSDLKAIVKECLIEILSEGLGSSLPVVKRNPLPRQENPYLEEKKSRPVKQESSTLPQLRDFIKKEAGGNRIMEDIFTDTAAVTLPKILQGEAKGSLPAKHTLAEQIVASTDLEDIFGEDAAAKWESYAFGNVIKK